MKTDITPVAKSSWQSDGWFCLAVFAISLASRIPALLVPPSAFYYNLDEWQLGITAIDRYLGVPPIILNKAGGVFGLLSMPLVLVHWITTSGLPRGTAGALSSLASYLSTIYCNPRPMFLYMRWLVALISCFGPVFLYLIGEYLTHERWVAVGCALCLSFQPIFYQESVMIAGEAWAVTFVLWGLWTLLRWPSPVGVFAAGFLSAAGVATRITILPFIAMSFLFAVGVLNDRPWKPLERVISAIRFAAGLLTGFLFWFPYVWVEPLRFAKNLLGNLDRPGTTSAAYLFIPNWLQAMGYGFAALFVLTLALAVWYGVRNRDRAIIGALAVLIIICMPTSLRSNVTYPRYFVATVPAVLVTLALIVRAAGRLKALWRICVGGLIFVCALTTGAQQLHREVALRKGDDLMNSLATLRSLQPSMVAFIPEEALTTYTFDLPEQLQNRLKERARQKRNDEGPLVQFLSARGIPAGAGRALLGNFNEYEESQFRRVAACNCPTSSRLDMRLYYDRTGVAASTIERLSLADMPLEEAVTDAASMQNVAILVPYREPRLGQPFWSGSSKWYWYQR